MSGLHRSDDPLDLKSSVALVVNQDTNEVLFQKNPHAVLPIASITKLMTALITVEADLDLAQNLKKTMFNYAAHRRPEHYRILIDRVGAEVTPANG